MKYSTLTFTLCRIPTVERLELEMQAWLSHGPLSVPEALAFQYAFERKNVYKEIPGI